jgi:hypothetical protein
MLNSAHLATSGIIDLTAHHLNAAQAKWDRLTLADYTEIKTVGALIAAVEGHYSLPHAQAKRDVELWIRDVGLVAR